MKKRLYIIFKPNIKKIIAPALLIFLSIIPSVTIRMIIFEFLAFPFGKLLDIFRYCDIPFLNPTGALIVGIIWSILLYIIICIISYIIKKDRRKKNTSSNT